MSQPIRLIRKIVWSDIFLARKKVLVGKNFGSGKKCGRINSLVGKFVGQINFCPQKICGWKKILFRKNFGETFFEWKKILVKKIWSENNFGLRE